MNQESGIKSQEEDVWKLAFYVEEVVTDIVLFRGSGEVSRVRIEPNRELLERLLPAIDDIRVESDLPDGYSSRRIAETVAGVWRRFGYYES
jgi:hypothetical protein